MSDDLIRLTKLHQAQNANIGDHLRSSNPSSDGRRPATTNTVDLFVLVEFEGSDQVD